MRDRRPRLVGAAPDAAGCSLGSALALPLPPCASASSCTAAVTEQCWSQCLGWAARLVSVEDCRLADQLNSILLKNRA
jgi:hypothetical protein